MNFYSSNFMGWNILNGSPYTKSRRKTNVYGDGHLHITAYRVFKPTLKSRNIRVLIKKKFPSQVLSPEVVDSHSLLTRPPHPKKTETPTSWGSCFLGVLDVPKISFPRFFEKQRIVKKNVIWQKIFFIKFPTKIVS